MVQSTCSISSCRPSGVSQVLALHDRGDHVRPRASWLELLGRALSLETFEPYPLTLLGRPLWNMFYARGVGHA